MLRKSTDQINRLLEFVTSFYRTLTSECNYPAKEAWILMGRCVADFFDSLKAIRAKSMAVEDISTSRQRAHVIWTLMEAHAMAIEFISVHFQSHPVIMKEVMQFQLEHRVDASQLTGLQTEVKALKSSLKEATDATTKAEAAAKLAKEAAAKANQECGNIRTELKKYERKKGS